ETCMARMAGTCAFHRAKTAAQNAHILVVNHALLLSDVATGSKVLPEYDYLVVDEAHHLEGATTNALSFKLTQFDLARMLKEIGNQSSGVLSRLIGAVGGALRPSDQAAFGQMIERAVSQSFRLEQFNREFFNALGEFAAFLREGQQPSNYAWQARILPATRKLTEWEEVEMMWGQMSETWRFLLKSLEGLYKAAADLFSDGNEEVEAPMGDLGNVYRRMTEAHNNLTALILDPSAGTVYWIEVKPKDDRLSLNAAPLHVGSLITEHIWNTKNAVALTSATLTTHGEFTYLRNRLGAEMADELALGSPFDYESSTLLYLGNDMPEPNQPNYEQTINRAIVTTAIATGGRMLVLFTSYAALKRAAQGITAPLARENIFVLEQGEGASANTLLESFKSTERAVLLGTKSFWEGVDVPGEALSVVVITKLPFDVPTDPLIAARSETYEDPFNEYYLPEAILKFRQGFGRLIRTQSDRGVVVILDKRVMTKQYGRSFLESLPQCTVRAASVVSLPKEAGKWLGV
ncbi:MAG: helicase C-terminal domain-containing protein, partial [Chloroflexota bacterium]